MPNHQQTPRKQSKAQIWAKRSVHLKSYLQDLPRRLRLDVEALVKQWLASPAHRAKILDPTLRRAGLGLVKPSKGHRTFTGVLLLTDELG